MHLKNGAVLQGGRYRIENLLGQGGFGITYLATQSGLNRKVAIKEFFMKDFCNRDAATSHVSVPSVCSREIVDKFKVKFMKEAQMISEYRHPNIVNIYDVFEDNSTAYYVMEYHDGGSLSSLDLPLSVEKASGYIRQIAAALSYLHKRDTMHLDVKPSNILLDENGNAVLIDFGVSKHYDQTGHQTSSTPVGISHGYAPGEQYQQKILSFSPATDIYALGATFYKLLTGLTPPHQNEVAENGLPIFPESVPESIASVIEKSMQPRRKDRPQSIEEFLGLLDSAMTSPALDKTSSDTADVEIVDAMPTDNPELGPEPSPETAPGPFPKKKSLKWLWLLLALLVAISCAAAVLFMGNDSKPAGSSETPSSILDAEQAKIDAKTYLLLMDVGAKYEKNEVTLQQAKEKYASAKELEDKWSRYKDYGSLFCQDAAGALRRVEDKLIEFQELATNFNDYFKKYNDLISAADKLYDKGDESSLKSAIENYKSAAEIESRYKGSEYFNRFNRKASTSVVRAEKRLAAPLDGTHKNHDWVNLGLSVKWATCNVGASNPGEYGNYYAWGETKTKKEYKYGECASLNQSWGDIGGNSSRDAATANWGGDWRLPTKAEFEELLDNCTWECTTQNGQYGHKVTSKKNGQSIFLPAAGYRDGADEIYVGSIGYYWSSTPFESDTSSAYYLYFYGGTHSVYWLLRYYGRSVRPVLDY